MYFWESWKCQKHGSTKMRTKGERLTEQLIGVKIKVNLKKLYWQRSSTVQTNHSVAWLVALFLTYCKIQPITDPSSPVPVIMSKGKQDIWAQWCPARDCWRNNLSLLCALRIAISKTIYPTMTSGGCFSWQKVLVEASCQELPEGESSHDKNVLGFYFWGGKCKCISKIEHFS